MYKKLLTLTAIQLCALAANAQTIFHNVEEAWQYADQHSTSIKNAQYEVTKANKGVTQSYLDFLPDVSANAGYTDNLTIQTTLIPAVIFGGPDGTYRPVQFGQKYIYNAGFAAQLDILNLQTWHNARIARETQELNKAQLSNTRRNIYQQVAGQYYACILNREAAVLAAKSAALADSIYQSINNKYEEGTVSLPNLDIAKLNSERAQQTAIAARYQLAVATNALKALIGLSLTDSVYISQRMDDGAKSIQQMAFNEDPAILLARHTAKLNYYKLKQSNAGIVPTLTASYVNNTQQFDNTFRPFSANGPEWFPANYWSLKATWNIFNGGNRWLQSQRNKIAWLQSQADEEQAKRQSAINDENLRLNYMRTAEMYTKAQNIVNLSLDNYQHITLRYEEGLASIEDRQRAFTDYINYQNQYLNTLSELLAQLYSIKLRQQSY